MNPDPPTPKPPELPAPELPAFPPPLPPELPPPLPAEALASFEREAIAEAVRPVDPWAHRRGEPRLFAFLWTVYVLLAVGGSILWVAQYASLTQSAYGPAGRIMLVVLTIGVCVLWPMVRLSQVSPKANILGFALADFVVVLLPLQLVLWPLTFLAGWPLNTVLGVAALLSAWAMLVSGLLALVQMRWPIHLESEKLTGEGPAQATLKHNFATARALKARTWCMIMLLAMILAPLAVKWGIWMVQGGRQSDGMMSRTPVWLDMLSPITAISALTGVGLIGPQAPLTAVQWEFIALAFAGGVAFWLAAAFCALFKRGDVA